MPAVAEPKPSHEVLQDEFLVGGYTGQMAAIQAVLSVSPLYIDDRTEQFGSEVYNRMLSDDDVGPAFETRKLACCSEGVRVQPAKGVDKKNQNDIKNVYAQFMERCLAGMTTDLTDVALELMDAKALGSKIAEIAIDFGSGEDAGRMVPTGLFVRDSKFFTFLLDAKQKLAGLVPISFLTEAQRTALESASTINPQLFGISNVVVPRYKVVHFVNDPKDSNILGTSCLRAAYTPWFIKTQLLPEFFKYLKQFASPSVVAKLPKPADDLMANAPTEQTVDGAGSIINTQKAQLLLDKLLAWQNAYAIVVKGGTEIDLLNSEGDGAAYRHALDYFGRQIAQVILGTAQATKEAQHESKSSKGVAQDVIGLRIANDRRRLGNCLTRDFSHNIIRLNFGDAAVKDAPSIVLSSIEAQDRLEAITTYANAYAKNFIQDEQLDDVYDEVGLPEMPEGWLQEKQAQAEQAALEKSKLYDPIGA